MAHLPEPPEERTVLVERRGAVGLVTLNRPAKLNALSRQLLTELEAALQALEADAEVGCIVVTGAGERAFSAGGDLSELGRGDRQPAQPSGARRPWVLLRARTKPTVAAVFGYCFGGGALLAMGADLRVGAEDTRIKFHGAGYGVAAGAAQLPSIVGAANARELLLTGDEVDARAALRMGFLNHVLPRAEVLGFAVGMAERIARNSPAAVAALRYVLDRALPTDEGLALEARLNAELSASSDTAERLRQAADRVLGAPRG